MKKLSKWTLVLLLLVTALFAVTACKSVEEIKIDKNSEQPQTIYVLGTELNRSKGAILASGEYEAVPLSDPAVEITGYDKNTLGKQTLTITYMGASTTLNIEVVPRMEPKNFNYFVGEEFSAGKSQLKINNDDGSSKVIGTDDPDLTIEGFDSSKPATPLTVKASYQTAEMKEAGIAPYTGDVDVNIFTVANGDGNGELHRPSKNAYESHELAVSASGGYLTLESANKELTRTVQVTPEMISGFDMSVATVDNMDTPVNQTLTIKYAIYTYTYNIQIKFSDVSLIKLRAKELNDRHDWSHGAPQVNEADGKLAREMTDMFLGLSETRQAYVEQEEFLSLARYTAIYERAIWEKQLQQYHFTVAGNVLVPSFKTLDEAKQDLDKLTLDDGTTIDPENELYKHAEDLSNILVAFYNFRFFSGQSIGAYLDNVCLPTEFQKVVLYIPYMENMYNALKDFTPERTQTDYRYDYQELKAHKDVIDNAYNAMYATVEAGLYNPQVPTDREYFKTVSRWRDEKDTYLRIIYQYYLDTILDEQGTDDSLKDRAKECFTYLQYFALPGDLEDYFVAFLNANVLWAQIPNAKSPLLDNTTFYLYYDKAYEIIDKVDKSDDTLLKDIYINLGLGSYLLGMKVNSINSRSGKLEYYGYVHLHDYYYKDETVDGLWKDYLDLVTNTVENPNYGAETQFTNDVENLFKKFMGMTPLRQVSFLISLDVHYLDGNPEHLFSFTEIYTYFVKLIADHYGDVLPAKAFETFQYFLFSVEDYARVQLDDSGECQKMYEENMQKTIDLYSTLQGNEKTAFDTYVGDYYNEYVQVFKGLEYSDYGEWSDEIEEMKGLIDNANSLFNAIMQIIAQSQGQPTQVNPMALFPALAAAYERADAFAYKILEEAPKDVVNKFKYEKTDLGFRDPETEEVVLVTLDFALYNARCGYMMVLQEDLDPKGSHTLLMDSYFGWGFDKILVEGYTAILNQFYIETQQSESIDFDAEAIYRALDLYFGLEVEQKANYLLNFDNMELFANGVQTFYRDEDMDEMARMAKRVFDVEATYILFLMDPDGQAENSSLTYQESFIQQVKTLRDNYEKLGDSDKAEFNAHFKKAYDFYEGKEKEVTEFKPETEE